MSVSRACSTNSPHLASDFAQERAPIHSTHDTSRSHSQLTFSLLPNVLINKIGSFLTCREILSFSRTGKTIQTRIQITDQISFPVTTDHIDFPEYSRWYKKVYKLINMIDKWKLQPDPTNNKPGIPFVIARSLGTLDLKGCYGLENDQLLTLIKKFPNLHTLNLYECSRITDQGAQAIAQYGKNLQVLDLSCHTFIPEPGIPARPPPRVTDLGVHAIAKSCTHLHTFYLEGRELITDLGLQAIAERCKNLHTLNLRKCHLITDLGIQAIAQHGTNLHTLNLSSCSKITDRGVETIAQHCQNLHTLNLDACSLITDRGVQVIVERFKNPHTLNLSFCELITDEGLRAIAQHGIDLHTLDISYCKLITDLGLQAIVEHCKNLRTLKLCWCSLITDRGAQAIAQHGTNLHTLDISYCELITDLGVQAIVEHCKNLHTLNLHGCDRITHEGTKAIAIKNITLPRHLHADPSWWA